MKNRSLLQNTVSLPLKRLGLRVIRWDREAAEVLGDAMQERGIDNILTGRTRPILFHALGGDDSRHDYHNTFYVRGIEVLYNVHSYTEREDSNKWGHIWRMWMTRKQDIYRALRSSKIINTPFRDIIWEPSFINHRLSDGSQSNLAYDVYRVQRVPRRKKPSRIHLLHIWLADPKQSVRLDEPGGIERDAARARRR